MTTLTLAPTITVERFLQERRLRTRSVPLIVEVSHPTLILPALASALQETPPTQQHWFALERAGDFKSLLVTYFPPKNTFSSSLVNCWRLPDRQQEVVVINNAHHMNEEEVDLMWRALYRAQQHAPALIFIGRKDTSTLLSFPHFQPDIDFKLLRL